MTNKIKITKYTKAKKQETIVQGYMDYFHFIIEFHDSLHDLYQTDSNYYVLE